MKQRKSKAAVCTGSHYLLSDRESPMLSEAAEDAIHSSLSLSRFLPSSISLSLRLPSPSLYSHSHCTSLSDAIVTLLAPSDWLRSTGDRSEQNSSRTQPYASRFDVTASAYYPIALLPYADHTTLSLLLFPLFAPFLSSLCYNCYNLDL